MDVERGQGQGRCRSARRSGTEDPPSVKNMGVWNRIAPLWSVAARLKILIPVGTAIRTVV